MLELMRKHVMSLLQKPYEEITFNAAILIIGSTPGSLSHMCTRRIAPVSPVQGASTEIASRGVTHWAKMSRP